MPYKYKDIHECNAVVFMCMDFRFRKKTLYCIEEALKISVFDLAGMPGASKRYLKDSRTALKSVEVAFKNHNVQTAIIVHHEDCAAYGGSKAFASVAEEQDFHEAELRRTKEKILQDYPGKSVILIYARLVNNQESVEFIEFD